MDKKQFKNRQFMFWCKRLIRVSLFSLYALVALDTNSSIAAPRGELQNWRFYPQGSQLEISLSAPSLPKYFYLTEPDRIVVDLPGTKLGYVPTQQNYSGAIQRIRVSQLSEDVTRIVMDLAPGTFFDRNRVQLQPASRGNPTRWVFRPLLANNGNFLPLENSSTVNGLPPGAYSPSAQPNNSPYSPQPPGAYSPAPPNNSLYSPQPPGTYSPAPPNNSLYSPQPPGTYSPAPPNNSLYSPQPPGMLTQPPSNLPPQNYNPSPISPGVSTQPTLKAPLSLPPVNINNGNQQQPTVKVPPLKQSSPFQQTPDSNLPPATFPSQSGNFTSPASIFPTPSNLPTIVTPPSNSGVIEFGQPFPNRDR